MKFIENWREELNKAWSIRVAIVTAFLGISDQLLTAFLGIGFMTPIIYSMLMIVITVAKIAYQKDDTKAT